MDCPFATPVARNFTPRLTIRGAEVLVEKRERNQKNPDLRAGVFPALLAPLKAARYGRNQYSSSPQQDASVATVGKVAPVGLTSAGPEPSRSRMRSWSHPTASGSTSRRARHSDSESTTVSDLELGVRRWVMSQMIPAPAHPRLA